MLRFLLVPVIAGLLIACGGDDKPKTTAPQAAAPAVTPQNCGTLAPNSPSGVSFTITPNTVKAGQEVKISGSGFTPNSIVTAMGMANGLCLPLGSGPADASGKIDQTRKVQALAPPGQYTVRVSDTAGHVATASVTLQAP